VQKTVLICLSALALFTASAKAEDYSGEFRDGWAFAQVNDSLITLDSSPDSPCEVKAYGWKLLSSRHKKYKSDPWYSLGDTYRKWGWKLILRNPGRKLVPVSVAVGLYTRENFLLDSERIPFLGGGAAAVLNPGETRTLTGVSEYNATSHKGEGDPAALGWSIRLAQANE